MDIYVKDRKIQCGLLQSLGVQGDNKVEEYRFLINRYTSAGVDLSQGLGYCVFKLSNGETGVVNIPVEMVGEDTVRLKLVVGKEMTAAKGRMSVVLKISGLEEALWQSEPAYFNVAATIETPSMMPVSYMTIDKPMLAIEKPETEPPITVSERMVNIPTELRTIAVAQDKNSETVKIVVPRYFDGNDLSEYVFSLHTEMGANGVDDILFNNTNGQMKEVKSSTVELTWVLRPPQTSWQGDLRVQVRVSGDDFEWHSYIGTFTVAEHIGGDPVVPVTPGLYEQLVQQIEQASGDIDKSVFAADKSAKDAAESAKSAAESASNLQGFVDAASEAADAASKSAEAAKASQDAAKESEDNALKSASDAKDAADRAQSISQGALGYYPTEEALKRDHETGEAGEWAIVGSTDTIWVWDDEEPGWTDSGNKTDLSNYYTKEQTDTKLGDVDAKAQEALGKVLYLYSAALTAEGWTGSDETGYTQTAQCTPQDGGPAVTPATQLGAPLARLTGDKEADEAMLAALWIINAGTVVLGDGTATVKVWEKPETETTVFWYGR